jgi:hypothetical protein
MKKVTVSAAFIVMMALCNASSCDIEDNESRGLQAAKEFCDCYRTKSRSDCEDALNAKYKYRIDDDFIDAFNKSQTCGATLYKK